MMSGRVSIPLLLAAVGLLTYFIISATFTFENKIFKSLFFKPRSFASELSSIPQVDLKIIYQDKSLDGALNLSSSDLPVSLSWTTTNNPTSCTGYSWGIHDQDNKWDGSKNPQGGTFTVENLSKANPYVYTINCTNFEGDGVGDSVSINIDAIPNLLPPYITSIKALNLKKTEGKSQPFIVKKGEKVLIEWSSLNTATPYSICVSSGSWPVVYKYQIDNTVSEEFYISQSKIHQFNIYCSNETSSAHQNLTFVTQD